MFLSINMPTWLVDFWTIYGDMITPVLVTVALALLTSLALKIKADAKTNAAKAELQIQALKDVANREDNKPQLEQQSQQIASMEQTLSHLSDMVNLAFQNSNLTPEIKNNLASLNNKIKYGSEDELVKELETKNAQLEEEVVALRSELENKVVVASEEKVTKRTRR